MLFNMRDKTSRKEAKTQYLTTREMKSKFAF